MASPIISTRELEVSLLFIDAVECKIFAGNVRRDHDGKEGPGYQRDPYRRKGWLEKRSTPKSFKRSLLRTIEVSPRSDGTYAIIDGGGRWVMSQLAKNTKLQCRIHHNLSREEEAKLFFEFDKEIYRLRAIDCFLALLASGDQTADIINGAVKPYEVAVSGRGTLKCVGQFQAIKNTPHGVRVLSETAALLAKHWSGYDGKEFASRTPPIDGKLFVCVAIIVDGVFETAEEDNTWTAKAQRDYIKALGDVLSKTSSTKVIEYLSKNYPTEKTVPSALLAAQWLMGKVNAKLDDFHLTKNALASGRLFASYSEPRTYSARVREEVAEEMKAAA